MSQREPTSVKKDYRERRNWVWYLGVVVMSLQVILVLTMVPRAFDESVLIGLVVIGGACGIGVVLVRFVRMRAEVGHDGVLVAANLTTRFYRWEDIASVGYGPSRFGGYCGHLMLLNGSQVELTTVRTKREVREIAIRLSGDLAPDSPLVGEEEPNRRPSLGMVIAATVVCILAMVGVVMDGDRAGLYAAGVAAFTLAVSRRKQR